MRLSSWLLSLRRSWCHCYLMVLWVSLLALYQNAADRYPLVLRFHCRWRRGRHPDAVLRVFFIPSPPSNFEDLLACSVSGRIRSSSTCALGTDGCADIILAFVLGMFSVALASYIYMRLSCVRCVSCRRPAAAACVSCRALCQLPVRRLAGQSRSDYEPLVLLEPKVCTDLLR